MKSNFAFLVATAASLLLAAPAVGAALRYANPDVPDVPAAFARIRTAGSRLGIWTRGVISYPFYSLNPAHDFGDNHFQGVQRLRTGAYVAISGSNIARKGDLTRYGLPQPPDVAKMAPAHGALFIAHLASRPARGAWGSNLNARTDQPAAEDRLVVDRTISLPLPSGTTLWHPGGLSVVGDVLVVAVENYNAKFGDVCSQILFFDVSDPEHPRLFPHRIDRSRPPVEDKAGGATMVRLPDGRFLVASQTTARVSFYLSRTTRFEDGFGARPSAVIDEKNVRAAPGLPRIKFGGSSAQFVRQTDGTLFLVSFKQNRAKPGKPARDVASLWRVNFPHDDYSATPVLTRVADRTFDGGLIGNGRWGNFGAAAGIYVTARGGLAIYATARWQTDHPGKVPSLADAKDGNYIHAGDPVFIPMVELWPR